mgnify:CR=1 FL=1
MNELTLNLTPNEIEELAKQWLLIDSPNANENDIKQFVMFCKLYNLNPWKKEAYFIKYSGKVQLVTNYLILLAKAKTNPKYYREEIEYYQNGKKLVGVKLSPEMDNVIIIVNIYDSLGNKISNYDFDVDSAKNNVNGAFKKTQFHSWAQKNAIVNAFRRTFPGELQGLYIAEEFFASNEAIKNIATEEKKINKFQELREYLDNKYENEKEKQELLRKFLKEKELKLQDLVNGNFEIEDFKKYEGELKNVESIEM